jgi:hypothetical protein
MPLFILSRFQPVKVNLNLGIIGLQCCENHMEAAKAGHLRCLERMKCEGRLLTSNSDERKTAGEVRKAELWDAALVACKARQAHVLKWLFRDGWPASVDATHKYSLSGLAQPLAVRCGRDMYSRRGVL